MIARNRRSASPGRGRGLRQRLPQRSEALLLPLLALSILVLLSTYTLFSYRSAIDRLTVEREREAAALARTLARSAGALDPAPLRSLLPPGSSVRWLDRAGRTTRSLTSTSGVRGEPITARSAFVDERQVEVALPSSVLLSRRRALGLLTPLVLVVDLAVLALLALSLRRMLAPVDRMLERLRSSGAESPAPGEELTVLARTFERALEVLVAPDADDPLLALRSTLGETPESGVLLIDAEGDVLALNRHGAAILGQSETPMPGESLDAVLAEHPVLIELLERARRGEPVQRWECELETPAGSRAIGLSVYPLRGEGARPRGHLVLFADLTEVHERDRQRRLAESLSSLGELTAGIAHEMRNSLATVKGYVGLLERRGIEREALDDLRHETSHMQRVLDDFLSFARPGSVRPEPLDPEALLHRVALDPSIPAVPVVVDEASSQHVARIDADPQLLERAIRNLVSNAARATAARGSSRPGDEAHALEPVVLRARAVGERVRIDVEDRGAGISPEVRERLFEPFVSGAPGGIGMGLALTRRIVLLHEGSIDVEARADGGTRFVVHLPRSGETPPWQDRYDS